MLIFGKCNFFFPGKVFQVEIVDFENNHFGEREEKL